MKSQPIAFMSYVRFDDQHENGRLTEFRERLSAEVRIQTGDEFIIFQDRNDIKWGQSWKERIEDSLKDVTFLIPIITPGFFKSSACRDELAKFSEREKKLKRNDLILPVYYIDTPLLNVEADRARDSLAELIASRQYTDWRDLRFESFTSPQVGKILAQLAIQIREAIGRIASPAKPTKKRSLGNRKTLTASRSSHKFPASRQLGARTEPPTHIVDPMHRGDHDTITKAIKSAKPGDRILIRPGLYKEGLVINKPLEIIGDGAREEIIVEATDKNALLFKTTMGRVANLSLRHMNKEGPYCIEIAQGRLELENCDITCYTYDYCIVIYNGADPYIRNNKIHDCKEAFGISIQDSSLGTIENNDIFSNNGGVVIDSNSSPTLRHNRIHDNKTSGVLVTNSGLGLLEGNDIFSNTYAGVEVTEFGDPVFLHNRIRDNKGHGIEVIESGLGKFEDNDIFMNGKAGVRIINSIPILRYNRINMNGDVAIWISNGGGTIEDNDLRANRKDAWKISANSKSKLKRSKNIE
jgi:parallel beta-helix repeat protein